MDDLRARLEAVERAVGDDEAGVLADEAGTAERVDRLEDDLADLADRVDEIEAATQALRGYAGEVRSVNDSVTKRADAALAAVEALEERLEDAGIDGQTDGHGERRVAGGRSTRRDG